MSDRKRNHEKKEKHVEVEELDKEYMEIPIQNKHNQGQMQHNCPMMYQCPMVHQCPMMPQPSMQMPGRQGGDLRVKDWFEEWDEEWDEFSEDSSLEFDDHDFYSPEKYYEKHNKHNQYPYFWPPYFPNYKK